MKQDELLKSYVKVTEDGVEGSAQAVSEFFRLAQVEEDTHEDEKEESVGFEKGDKVRLTLNGKESARFGLSTVKDGDIGTVMRVRERGYDDTVIDVEFPNHPECNADPSELTKITEDESVVENIKKGDIVVVIDNTSGSLNKVGDIGIVSECGECGGRIEVPGGVTSNNNHYYRDLRLADGKEKAQYHVNKAKEDGTYHEGMPKEGDKIVVVDGQHELFEKYEDGDILTVKRVHEDGSGDVDVIETGEFLIRSEFEIIERKDEKERKQGRFAIGDIVYYEDDTWFENEGYGEVIGFGDLSGEPRVKALSNFGIEYRYVINSENLTLVCKAENREDK